ncbi:multidrug effflux MFS transporter [Psychromonas sp. 14N.309.X.WAT.B.A12]|uniref:multidrug effflux MFS transporter n=1 Tax=unclassified Psychromonas TaxID=2614957 RepID=UPI0025B15C97|nr:multidrug effflux MFS transporter [Psychromonas sp. 14N.309.X.WAT.B.A12]MDN2661977.1 multidrug effflux MFS transporter [Psychromonas sp. 14N.309.X.WAT.B.A12]
MTTPQPNKVSKRLIITLSSIYAISPFAIDSYLPAIPLIANEMQVDISLLSVTVSLYILGLAIGQLIGGPLSDKHGRLPIMLLGLAIFASASLLLTTSTHIAWLWGWRLMQAIGGGIAIVGVPATIRDNADGKEAAKLFALVALIMMIAPSIAPTIGNLILSLQSWHWIFYFTAGFSCVAMLMAKKYVPHQSKKQKKLLAITIERNKGIKFIEVFKHKQGIGYMMAQAFAFAVMMTFVTNSAMIYLSIYEVSTTTFTQLFALNIGGLIFINRLNTLLLNRFEPATLARCFLTMQFSGGILLVTSSWLAPNNLTLTVIGFMLMISANGGVMANCNACFLKYFGKNAGTASAVLGAFQCAMGATVSAFAAFISMGYLQPVVLIMLLSSTVALTAVIHSNKQARLAENLEADNL